MKNSMSNFGEFALSISEMKSVIGGCGVKINGTWSYGLPNSSVVQMVRTGIGTNWCCASCNQQ